VGILPALKNQIQRGRDAHATEKQID